MLFIAPVFGDLDLAARGD